MPRLETELKEVLDKLYVNPPELSDEEKAKFGKKIEETSSKLDLAKRNNDTANINKYQHKMQALINKVMQFNNFVFSNREKEIEAQQTLERIARDENPVSVFRKTQAFLEAKKQELNQRERYRIEKELNEVLDEYDDTEAAAMQLTFQDINNRINALQDLLQDLKLQGDFNAYSQRETELFQLYDDQKKLALDIRNREYDKRISRKLFLQESLLDPQGVASHVKQLLEEQKIILFNKELEKLFNEAQDQLEAYNSYLASVEDTKAKLQTEIEAEHKSLEMKQALKSNYTKHERRIAEIMKELSDIASNESTYSREKKLLESMLARVEKTKDSKKKMEILEKAAKKE